MFKQKWKRNGTFLSATVYELTGFINPESYMIGLFDHLQLYELMDFINRHQSTFTLTAAEWYTEFLTEMYQTLFSQYPHTKGKKAVWL